ncbi:uncharacterized protein BJ171DRAFT_601256 [Polychytrium aggregatum]|uniref:uncharacterized protein n=1 Tax=Polychytrium aggregatum TaxID=110093 RepID=UPI0022FDFC2F|nr:uncharacterized protein BJ171DRAFT_601256 [Polychytrium aggregatum]KAI9202120.1 hypothetical protein BJ171DRAFT_601256 [Polychytrium aggregatum]
MIFESSANDSHASLSIGQLVKTSKRVLFDILMVLTLEDEHRSLIWIIIENLIMHLQDLAFPLSFILFPWQTEIQWLQEALHYTNPQFEACIFILPDVFSYAIYAVITALVFVILILADSVVNRHRRFRWVMTILQWIVTLSSNILHVPITCALANSFLICSNVSTSQLSWEVVSIADCWSSQATTSVANPLLRSVLSLIFLIIYIPLLFLLQLARFHPYPSKKDVTCRSHTRLSLLEFAGRTVLAIGSMVLLAINGDIQYKRWIMLLACFLYSHAMAFLYLMYSPYYHFSFACVKGGLLCSMAFASELLIITMARGNSDIGLIFLISLPLPFIFAYIFMSNRRAQLLAFPLSRINSAYMAELKARYILDTEGLLFRPPPKMNTAQRKPSGSPGDIIDSEEVVKKNLRSQPNIRDEERDQRTLSDLSQFFANNLQKFPESVAIFLFACRFYVLQLGNRAQCISACSKATQLSPAIDEQFLIHRIKFTQDDSEAGGEGGFNFIAYEQIMEKIKRNEVKIETVIIEFWKELLRSNPSVRKLTQTSLKISELISVIQSDYINIIKNMPKSPQPYRRYGDFLMNIMNDDRYGKEILLRAEELEETRAKVDRGSDSEDGEDVPVSGDVYDETYGTITISGKPESMGIITHVNDAALQILSFRRPQMIGKNVNIMIPSPLAEAHDDLLKKYIQTGYAKVIDRKRMVIGLNANGHLVPLTICVRHINDADGNIAFLGIIKDAPSNPSKCQELLVLNSNLEIRHVTAGIINIFGIWDEDETPNIAEWIPALTVPNLAKFTDKAGYKEKLSFNGREYDMTIKLEQLPIGKHYICRIEYPRLNSQLSAVPSNLESIVDSESAMPMTFSADGSRELHGPQKKDSLRDFSGLLVPPPPKSLMRTASVGNSSSVASSAAGNRTARIRKMIFKKNRIIKQHIRNLGRYFLLLILFIIACGVLLTCLLQTNLSNVLNIFQSAKSFYFGARSMVITLSQARSVDLFMKGAALQPPNSSVSQSTIIANLPNIRSAQLQMIQFGNVNYTTRINGSTSVIESVTSYNAVGRYIMSLQCVANSTAANYFNVSNCIALLLENCINNVVPTIGPAFGAGLQTNQIGSYLLYVSLIPPLFLMAIYIFIIHPSYFRIKKDQERFFRIFFSIPKEVIKGICEGHQERLTGMTDEMEEDQGVEAFNANATGVSGRSNAVKNNTAESPNIRKRDKLLKSNQNCCLVAWRRFEEMHIKFDDSHGLRRKVALLLLLVITFFLAVGVVTYFFFGMATTQFSRVDMVIRRSVSTEGVYFVLREYYLNATPVMNPHTLNRQDLYGYSWSNTSNNFINLLGTIEMTLAYGSGTSATFGSTTSNEYAVSMVNGCINSTSPSDCATFDSGVIASGLHPAILRFLDIAQNVSNWIQSSPNSSGIITQLKLLRKYNDMYLPPACDNILSSSVDPITNWIGWLLVFYETFSAITGIFLIVTHFGIMYPLLQRLSFDIQRAHTMMFMIPEEALDKMDMIKEWAEGISS